MTAADTEVAGTPAPPKVPSKGSRMAEWVGLYCLSITGALVLSAILVEATGGDWRPVMEALLDGSLLRPGRWGEDVGGHGTAADRRCRNGGFRTRRVDQHWPGGPAPSSGRRWPPTSRS